MNFRQQLQEAYQAGYESGLNELNLQGLKNFGTDLLYGPGYTRREQSIKDAEDIANLPVRARLNYTPDRLMKFKKMLDNMEDYRREVQRRKLFGQR